MADTTFILDALKAFYVHTADPSQMGVTPEQGLAEQEKDLASITEQAIIDSLSGSDLSYEEAELLVSQTIGSNLTSLLLGDADPGDFEMIPPSIEFYLAGINCSSSSNWLCSISSSSSLGEGLALEILPNTNYKIISTVYGGNIPYTAFNHRWDITAAPAGGDVIITEIFNDQTINNWDIGTLLNFTTEGFYTLELVLTHTTILDLEVLRRLTATVSSGV